MISLNKFAKEVHQNAVDHGWWEPEPSFSEVIAMCHSELSEALEEYRAGRPMEWYRCNAIPGGWECKPGEGGCIEDEDECTCKSDKPEGVAVEMIDCLLRILDYLYAVKKHRFVIVPCGFMKSDKFKLLECITELHAGLSNAWNVHREHSDDLGCIMLCACAGQIITWLEVNYGVNWGELLLCKHEYNKTRPCRHGGKKI